MPACLHSRHPQRGSASKDRAGAGPTVQVKVVVAAFRFSRCAFGCRPWGPPPPASWGRRVGGPHGLCTGVGSLRVQPDRSDGPPSCGFGLTIAPDVRRGHLVERGWRSARRAPFPSPRWALVGCHESGWRLVADARVLYQGGEGLGPRSAPPRSSRKPRVGHVGVYLQVRTAPRRRGCPVRDSWPAERRGPRRAAPSSPSSLRPSWAAVVGVQHQGTGEGTFRTKTARLRTKAAKSAVSRVMDLPADDIPAEDVDDEVEVEEGAGNRRGQATLYPSSRSGRAPWPRRLVGGLNARGRTGATRRWF